MRLPEACERELGPAARYYRPPVSVSYKQLDDRDLAFVNDDLFIQVQKWLLVLDPERLIAYVVYSG